MTLNSLGDKVHHPIFFSSQIITHGSVPQELLARASNTQVVDPNHPIHPRTRWSGAQMKSEADNTTQPQIIITNNPHWSSCPSLPDTPGFLGIFRMCSWAASVWESPTRALHCSPRYENMSGRSLCTSVHSARSPQGCKLKEYSEQDLDQFLQCA